MCDTCGGDIELPRDMWRDHYRDGSRWVWKEPASEAAKAGAGAGAGAGDGDGTARGAGGHGETESSAVSSVSSSATRRPLVQRFYRTEKKVFEKHEVTLAWVTLG